MDSWRLLECPPARGDWNMAVDAALLERAAATGQVSLRFYAWEEPTLSLGYFQAIGGRRSHPPSNACPIVRRPTGGGAIVHDRELTYSLVMPRASKYARDASALYRLVSGSLVDALGDWGVKALLCENPPRLPAADEPFLCFQRRSGWDVLVGGAKIAGSAQRRRQGAVLGHGSVLLSRSAAAPELAGLVEVSGVAIPSAALGAAWQERLAKACRISWRLGLLDETEIELARRLVDEVYGSERWTRRR
ncbi:MAG: lipoate--protein ligase [Planctomycetia bacterium]|nr:lipoate--protein ligase [Planctomycetia bacterium]